ncbi:MAG TPA: DUF2269 family protein [Candidatus Limnocylindrales bacterium]|nr:DUF2269 family protein [Candidatus Limnocylindrales bacterium]
MALADLFPLIVATHVALAIGLFLPSILLPFGLRLHGGRWQEGPGRLSRALFWLQRNGTLVIGAGLGLTGVLLVFTLGTQILAQPWLLLALAIYAANLVLALFIQRPGLARLLRLQPDASEEARRRWRDWARRQRYFSYLMAGLIGVIAFLMSTKPDL